MTVTHEPDASQYVVYDGDTAQGWIDYDSRDGALRLLHTEVPKNEREQGVGTEVVRVILDEIRATTDARIEPLCPFVRTWLERHPDYADLTTR